MRIGHKGESTSTIWLFFSSSFWLTHRTPQFPYAGEVLTSLKVSIRNWLEVPQPSSIPRRSRRDYVLVTFVAVLSGLGVLFEPAVAWRPVAFPLAIGLAALLLWRRSNPLAVVILAFSAQAVVDVITYAATKESTLVGATVLAGLILTYALWRWAPGRDVGVGMAVILITHVITAIVDPVTGVLEAFFGTTLWLFPAALALAMRYRETIAERRIAEARFSERNLLARELHDTVAHHVSAIAIQAQAGQIVAGSSPEAAVEVLRTVEVAASSALDEMRQLVKVLRDPEIDADTIPQSGLAQIEAFADNLGTPKIDVQLNGDLEQLAPSIQASLFRLAQESITNARRHSRHATRVNVRVDGSSEEVRLSVSDDGDRPSSGQRSPGFGLVGMAERVALLGGTFEAQPGIDRGWTVAATIPLTGGTP